MAVTFTDELLARAEAWASMPLNDKRYPAGLAELTQLYTLITGQQIGSCRQCQFSDYQAVVIAYIRQATYILHPELMPNSNYVIAPGFEAETFTHDAWTKAVTAENLTDEDAEFFISKGMDKQFLRKPEAKAEKAGQSGKPLTEKQQLQARFAELFGNPADEKVTIAQLTEHIEAKEANADYQVPTA